MAQENQKDLVMTQEQKDLVMKDLCGRLPYGVYVQVIDRVGYTHTWKLTPEDIQKMWSYKSIKPYLRPMSSMTEEEQRKLQSFFPGSFGSQYLDLDKEKIELYECNSTMEFDLYDSVQIVDFCKKNHLDCCGLVKNDLAIEVDEFYNPYED